MPGQRVGAQAGELLMLLLTTCPEAGRRRLAEQEEMYHGSSIGL